MLINAKLIQDDVIRMCMSYEKKLFYVAPYIGWVPTFETYKIQSAVRSYGSSSMLDAYIEARIDNCNIARDIIAISFSDNISAYRGIIQFVEELETVYHCRKIIVDVVSNNPGRSSIVKYCLKHNYKLCALFLNDKMYGGQLSDVEFYEKVLR